MDKKNIHIKIQHTDGLKNQDSDGIYLKASHLEGLDTFKLQNTAC